MNSSTQARQPAGTPTGGQWSGTEGADAGLDLAEPEQQSLSPDDQADLERIMGIVKANAPGLMRKYGDFADWDLDDLTGDVMMVHVNSAAKGGDLSRVTASYLTTQMRGMLNNAVHQERMGRNASEHAKASGSSKSGYAAYSEQVRKFEAELQRELTEAEKDAISEQVRESMPANNRPAKGFHRWTNRVSADVEAVANRASRAADELEGGMPMTERDRVIVSEVVNGDPAARARHGWRALCATRGIPAPPDKPWLSYTRSRKTVTVVGNTSDDVLDLVDDWREGKIADDDPKVEALFSAFSDKPMDARQRDQVASVVTDHPDRAYQVWRLALSGASESKAEAEARSAK